MNGNSKEVNLEKIPSVISVNGDHLNTSSTLKLADNEITQGKNGSSYTVNQKDLEAYDPFEYRDKTNATPDAGALIHLLKSSLGSGILAMPSGFLHGGLIFGIIGTIVVGYICTHCVQLLVDCSQLLSVRVKTPYLGFAETAETAFNSGPKFLKPYAVFARHFVKAALFATYYFGNTVYVVFVATSFQQVIENQLDFHMDIRLYILLMSIPLVPLGIIRTMKYLVPFSTMATAFILFGLAITLYYTFDQLPPMSSRHYITAPTQWPLFFATVLFAMEGIGTVLPIENSMRNPQRFLGCPGVLNIAMTTIVILYGTVGFFGYLKFGEETEGSITLNLDKNSILAEVVKILVALSILFTYGLQFCVPSEIMWNAIGHKFSENWKTAGYYFMRGLMILGTVVVGVIIPNLSPFISLVGAVCFSILGLFCPAVIELATLYEEGYGFLKWILVKDIIIIILSIMALISGSYSSINEIAAAYMSS